MREATGVGGADPSRCPTKWIVPPGERGGQELPAHLAAGRGPRAAGRPSNPPPVQHLQKLQEIGPFLELPLTSCVVPASGIPPDEPAPPPPARGTKVNG